ncbi:hypothetical protein BT63DRAFT_468439 [Microthyrium microscopicum]|uniref:Uncharacterized protein n=1 Tax=Microthyrium microscopicum TaxID=703497 RepID=A0A6A6UJR2_9PEZI|nr:hypothetical protein BT63DRAFT_468439 [Microthyrium microscopicum]
MDFKLPKADGLLNPSTPEFVPVSLYSPRSDIKQRKATMSNGNSSTGSPLKKSWSLGDAARLAIQESYHSAAKENPGDNDGVQSLHSNSDLRSHVTPVAPSTPKNNPTTVRFGDLPQTNSPYSQIRVELPFRPYLGKLDIIPFPTLSSSEQQRSALGQSSEVYRQANFPVLPYQEHNDSAVPVPMRAAIDPVAYHSSAQPVRTVASRGCEDIFNIPREPRSKTKPFLENTKSHAVVGSINAPKTKLHQKPEAAAGFAWASLSAIPQLRTTLEPVPPLHELRFGKPIDNRRPSQKKNLLLDLPDHIKEMIWKYVLYGLIPCAYLAHSHLTSITFSPKSGQTCGLPQAALKFRHLVELVKALAISHQVFEDASKVFCASFLPRMATEFYNLEDYNNAIAYLLPRCPNHMILFTGNTRIKGPPPTHSCHYLRWEALLCTRNDKTRPASLSAHHVSLERDMSNVYDDYVIRSHRSPYSYDLQGINVDGTVGDTFWWLHTFCDYVYENRAHWSRIRPLMADFVERMRSWQQKHGIPMPESVKLAVIISVDSTYENMNPAEWKQSFRNIYQLLHQWRADYY